MAAVENVSTISEDDGKYGFQRPEMYSANLSNTVDAYDRHVFLCYKRPEALRTPTPVCSPSCSTTPSRPRKTKLTICGSSCDDVEDCSDGTVLIFPEMTKYWGLTEANVDQFVYNVLVNEIPWTHREQERIKVLSSFVFVCAHGSRDKRCGVCGPQLIERFNDEIESCNLKDTVVVSPCSHIGGHNYAGNVIIYSRDLKGEVVGHWYGYVSPEDVPGLILGQIVNGRPMDRLWRGKMGPVPLKRRYAKEKYNKGGCCRCPNGLSCCREPPNKTVPCKLCSWVGKWEQNELYTAAAVVAAAATIAVGYYSFYNAAAATIAVGYYSFYKRSHH